MRAPARKLLAQEAGTIALHSDVRYPYTIRTLSLALNQALIYKQSFDKGKKAPDRMILWMRALPKGCHTIGVRAELRLQASLFGKKHFSMVYKSVFSFRGGLGRKVRLLFRDRGVMHAFFKRIQVEMEKFPQRLPGFVACKNNIKPEAYQFAAGPAKGALAKTAARPSQRPTHEKRAVPVKARASKESLFVLPTALNSRPTPARRPTPRR